MRGWIVALVLVACTAGGGRFELVVPGEDGAPALPLALEDRTGLVSGIARRDRGVLLHEDGVANAPGRSDLLAVTWVTGFCTEASGMIFERAAGGYVLTVVTRDRPGPCELVGFVRTVIIQLTAPVDAATVHFVERST